MLQPLPAHDENGGRPSDLPVVNRHKYDQGRLLSS